jgi:hypothetical protein
MNLDKNYGGGYIQPWPIAQENAIPSGIGIENMLLMSEYEPGQENKDEAHSWIAIDFNIVKDAWATDVTAKYFVHGFHVRYQGESVTIQDCQYLDPVSTITGERRYGFYVNGQRVLINRGYANRGRHDFVTGSRVQGPNVFFNSSALISYSDTGPHHRWAFGILYDSITADVINCQNRGQLGTGQVNYFINLINKRFNLLGMVWRLPCFLEM